MFLPCQWQLDHGNSLITCIHARRCCPTFVASQQIYFIARAYYFFSTDTFLLSSFSHYPYVFLANQWFSPGPSILPWRYSCCGDGVQGQRVPSAGLPIWRLPAVFCMCVVSCVHTMCSKGLTRKYCLEECRQKNNDKMSSNENLTVLLQ